MSKMTAYTVHRLEQGAKAATVNHELKILRRAFKLALQGKEITEAPHVPLLEVDNTREGFFERDEFEAVRAALPEALRPLVTFMYLTGWRRREATGLRWSQVDRTAGSIRLEPGTTKNKEARVLPYILDRLSSIPADALDTESLRTSEPVIAKTIAKTAVNNLYQSGKVGRLGTGKRGDP